MIANKPSQGKRKTLGRGLSALFGEVNVEGPVTSASEKPSFIAIERIKPGPGQPRRIFNEEELKTLAESIQQKGILQPLILRKANGGISDHYEIVAGERRWRAAQLVQMHEVPAIIGDYDDTEVVEIGLIENIQRSDLSPIEEARGFARLMDHHGYTQAQVAEAVGKSRSYVANAQRLLHLPEEVMELLESGKLSVGHARALLSSNDPGRLAVKVLAHGLSVRATEKLTQNQESLVPSKERKKNEASTGPKVKEQDPDLYLVQEEIYEKLGLKIEIRTLGDEGGEVLIHYASLEEFDYLFQKLTS